MKQRNIIFIAALIVLMASCKNERISTPEQEKTFDHYRSVIIRHQDLILPHARYNDSARVIMQDVLQLKLDNLAYKYDFTKKDIDVFLLSLHVTVEVVEAFEKLENAFK